jgi:hypothetical protein
LDKILRTRSFSSTSLTRTQKRKRRREKKKKKKGQKTEGDPLAQVKKVISCSDVVGECRRPELARPEVMKVIRRDARNGAGDRHP